jgi:predicted O-linked N-acetylglucosamine transferase (SPINDLY family)
VHENGGHTEMLIGPPPAPDLAGMSFESLVAVIEQTQPGIRLSDIDLYREWLAANAQISPHLFAGWYNLGATLAKQGDRTNAVIAYGNALALKPDFSPAAVNLGLSLEAQGDTEAALAAWARALQPDSAQTMLLNHRGRLLERLGRLDEAESTLRRSLLLDPQQPDVIQHFVHIRQRMCRWPVLEDLPGLSARTQLANCGPLGVLALTDDVDLQRDVAAGWIARKTEPIPYRLSPPTGYDHSRIRLGYLSSDFCRHAMSFLVAALFEHHDRSRFDVYGYCSSPEDGSDIRHRVTSAFDHHRIIRDLTDAQAAALIRADEIDILIDLNGLTAGARLQILRYRPAPVQATYLGFIGPIPLPELDYLFADSFVIPPAEAHAYRPAPLAIARSYQANDRQRDVAPAATRTEAGLPEDAFVFCCFCNHYKITQQMFAAWMTILRATPHAVLWLCPDNAASPDALRKAAGAAGISEHRLIFADRVAPAAYLSRMRLADLFLDTFPYTAGTVASDALRMALPLLTLCGRAFASRMAARLLDLLGAHDGIVHTLDDYVARAVQLASDRSACERFKAHFTADAWSASIGNIEIFAAEFETTLQGICLRPPGVS